LGVKHLLQNQTSEIFNLGNGNGFSVKEVIEAAKKVTGREIKVIESDRREGDPPALVGSGEKAKKMLGWNPKYADLNLILQHAWQWHQQRHG
jgi:UDP-glucose 4-epimerase